MKKVLAFIKYLGLPIAEDKVQGPTSKVKYLGIWIDVETRIISMPDEKIARFQKLIEWIMTQESV